MMDGNEALEKFLRGELSRDEALRVIAKGIPNHVRRMTKKLPKIMAIEQPKEVNKK